MSKDNALEKALVEALGLNKEALVSGTVRLDFEGGVPHLYFESNYVVPPEMMAIAFQSMVPKPDPAPEQPDAPSEPPAFPEAPNPGPEDPAENVEVPEENRPKRRTRTSPKPVPEA